MIETSLVYIYSVPPAHGFKGCGALVEGGFIATCRHVWRIAQTGEPAEVEIEFPFGTKQKVSDGDMLVSPTRRARLADSCEPDDTTAPDLVLLALVEPATQPSGVKDVRPASHDRFEVGSGFVHAGLIGRDQYNSSRVMDVRVEGKIVDFINADRLRQFTGGNSV